MRIVKKILIILVTFFSFIAWSKTLLINGAGATFPYILYSKWFYEYSKVNESARINYRSIGSGGGIRQLIKGTLDFGASDVPMRIDEVKKANKEIIHIPTTLSAVVITYNVNLSEKKLKLSNEVIAGIFSGKITNWDDVRIAQLNPQISLPEQSIVVVYRADGSGTTAIFTEYLHKTQPNQWKIGHGKSVNWPVGIGGKGNEGVVGFLKKTKGAIAYVGMGYALNQKLPVSLIQNASGEFIEPTITSVQSAATQIKNSYLESIVNSTHKKAYPLASFTYLLVYKKMKQEKGAVMIDFLNWALQKGQTYSPSMYYVPLPQNVIQKAQAQIKNIKLLDNVSS